MARHHQRRPPSPGRSAAKRSCPRPTAAAARLRRALASRGASAPGRSKDPPRPRPSHWRCWHGPAGFHHLKPCAPTSTIASFSGSFGRRLGVRMRLGDIGGIMQPDPSAGSVGTRCPFRLQRRKADAGDEAQGVMLIADHGDVACAIRHPQHFRRHARHQAAAPGAAPPACAAPRHRHPASDWRRRILRHWSPAKPARADAAWNSGASPKGLAAPR